jgi:hypothetical protein
MPKFSNGRITTNVIIYDRGVPNSAKNFGTLVSINYEILKQLQIYNRRRNAVTTITNNGRPIYTLF